MSNRNFDNRVIIQRLQQQTYARNLYQTNMNGQTLISNPQNSDSTSSRLTTFVSGAQTDYFRGLLGAGETVSLGGIFGISPFVPSTVPSSPIITEITDGNQQLTVSFLAPISYGKSFIIGYQYSVDNGISFISAGSVVSPIIITGLTNGITYQVVIRAVNSNGFGDNSNMVEGTPATIPTAPTITGITDGNQQLTVTFTAPTSNGGATITDYQYQISQTGSSPPTPSFISIGPTVSPFTITGLTNGTSYDVVIKAINRMGDGPTSDPVTGTPATIPTAPTITGITDGNQQLTVTFMAPTSNGGATITNYKYSTDDGTTFTALNPVDTVSTITIPNISDTPLTNGTTYPVRILAVNRMGDGAISNMLEGTPATIPTAPTITGITDGNQQLTITFNAPLSNGGSTITNYKYSTDNGTTFTALDPVDTASTITIPNSATLTNGTTYPVRILAVNRMGDGAISNMLEGTPATVPEAPTITVTGQNQSLSVAFDPTPNGGATITGYQYLVNNSSYTCAGFVESNVSPIIITGLTNGATYQVFIIAVNRMGNGPPSATQQGTPATVPSAPTNIVITAGNQTLSVAFTAPTLDGGSAITNYEYSIDASGNSFTALSPADTISPITIPNSATLTNGTSYPVRIRAVTLIGNGASSTPVTATPVSVPSAPTNIVITSGNQSLSVAFTAPISDGGSPITNYEYSINSGPFTALNPVDTTSPLTISGLANGISYPVRIRAVTLIGNGAPSDPVSGVPRGPPSAPTITGITEQNGQLAVAFSPPATDSGAFISDYQYAVNGGSFVPAGTTTSPITITGLTNGTSYSVQIKAVNSVGAGTGSNTVTATPQPTGPNVFQTTIQGQADTYTLICTKFTSFTPTTASVLYTPYGQLTPQSIDNSGTTTNMVMPDWSSQNLATANIYITFSDGIRTSMNSNTFNFFDILVFI